jgi:hypothetical protein
MKNINAPLLFKITEEAEEEYESNVFKKDRTYAKKKFRRRDWLHHFNDGHSIIVLILMLVFQILLPGSLLFLTPSLETVLGVCLLSLTIPYYFLWTRQSIFLGPVDMLATRRRYTLKSILIYTKATRCAATILLFIDSLIFTELVRVTDPHDQKINSILFVMVLFICTFWLNRIEGRNSQITREGALRISSLKKLVKELRENLIYRSTRIDLLTDFSLRLDSILMLPIEGAENFRGSPTFADFTFRHAILYAIQHYELIHCTPTSTPVQLLS